MNIEEAIDILVPKENIDLSNHFNNTRFFEAIYTLLTAYEQKCNYIKENEIYKKNLFNNYEEKCKELEKEKEKNKEYEKQLDLDYAEEKIKEAYIDGTNVAHNLCNKKWVEIIQAQIQELENERKDLVYAQPFVDGQIGVLKRVLKRGEE